MKQGEIIDTERQRKSNAPEILRHKALLLQELKRLATQDEEEGEKKSKKFEKKKPKRSTM